MSRLEDFDLGNADWKLRRPAQAALPFGDQYGIAEGPPELEERAAGNSESQRFGKHATKWLTGRTKPVEHVYRGMSQDEWDTARSQGFIRSDGRGAISPEWEGTNASLTRDTAEYYRETNPESARRGVVAKIAVHPDDQWFASSADSYLRTRRRIPLHRVVSVTQFGGDRG